MNDPLSRPDGPQQARDRRDPWDRFGWLMGVIWVFFLYFPIHAALAAGLGPVATAVAVGSLVCFGIVYIAGMVWVTGAHEPEAGWRRAWPVLVVLGVLLAIALVLVGVPALGAMPFVIALSMFAGSLRRSLTIALALFVLLVFALVASGSLEDEWWAVIPAVIVIVMTGTVRWVTARQMEHDELERQLDLVEERERVARDVHDTLGHSLTVVTVKAELAERLIDRDPEAARREIAQIRSLSREALAEVRATVAGLRVARLSDEIEAARTALEGAGIAHDVPDDADEVDPRRRILAAWTLREAVTNVVRHSRASRCVVRFRVDGMTVEDDGVGMPPEVAASGLRSIRERVEAARGTLEVGASDAGGTRLEVRW